MRAGCSKMSSLVKSTDRSLIPEACYGDDFGVTGAAAGGFSDFDSLRK